MEPQSDQPPVIVIVGETASGKSALALELAQRFNGEIIAADSRTIYRGMDIGTAKPSRDERAIMPHHLINIVDPDQSFTAADYKEAALAVIEQVTGRQKIPFLVGGTGLYIDAVLYNFSFATQPDLKERVRLESLSVKQLQYELQERGIPLPANEKNPRHLIRQLETEGKMGHRETLRSNTLIIGIEQDREQSQRRIEERVAAMFASGLEEEVRQLVARYGWDCAVLQTIGYQEFKPYFEGLATLAEVQAEIEKNTIRYAKRQRTWFKRNKSIHWLNKREEAVDLVTTFLNKSSIANG